MTEHTQVAAKVRWVSGRCYVGCRSRRRLIRGGEALANRSSAGYWGESLGSPARCWREETRGEATTWRSMDRLLMLDVGIGRNHKLLLDDSCRSSKLHKRILILRFFRGALRANITNNRVKARSYKLRVILMEDLLMNNGRILDLLGVSGLNEKQLNRQNQLQNNAVENCDARSRVQRHKREKHHIDEYVTGTEQAEKLQGDRKGVPYAQLPHVMRSIGMGSRLGGFRDHKTAKQPKRRRGSRIGSGLDSLGRRSMRFIFDVDLEQPVLSCSGHGVESVGKR